MTIVPKIDFLGIILNYKDLVSVVNINLESGDAEESDIQTVKNDISVIDRIITYAEETFSIYDIYYKRKDLLHTITRVILIE